jgi:hypothetical protein
VLVDPLLDDLFDAESMRLVRLGLVGQVHIEVTLVRKRALWFDERLDDQSLDLHVLWDQRDEHFHLESGREVDPAHLPTERFALRPGRDTDGDLEVQISAHLQVVTASSLGLVATWVAAKEREGGVAKGVVSALAGDLSREAKGSCKLGQ